MITKPRLTKGFTVAELLVVIVVIGILGSLTLVSYAGVQKRAIVASIKADLLSATHVLKLYQVDNNAYPTAIDDCPLPSANKTCITASPGTTYEYSYNNNVTPQTFSLTATNNGNSYVITNSTSPTEVPSTVSITSIADITGTARVGQVLTAGTVAPSGATVSYQWQIVATVGGSYSNISGANTNQYTPVAGDVGKYIKVSVTGTGNYSGNLTSNATSAVLGAITSVTVNGTAFANNNPYDGLTWWGADYTDDDGDTKWETASTFNLSAYVNGTISNVTLSWNFSTTGAGNGGRNRYIVAASPRSILYTTGTTTYPTSYTGSNLTTYVNSKKGNTCTINWEADYGSEGADIWGIEHGMSNPRLTFTWTPN